MNARLRRAQRSARGALGYGHAGRFATIRQDDILFVSYPRSGNTWLRFLASNLSDPTSPADFLNIEHRVPDIYLNSDRAMLRLTAPRILKSHEGFDPRYGRVLYIVRDPRDVVTSYFRWQVRSGSVAVSCSPSHFLPRFLEGEPPFGSWQTHVGSWWGARTKDPTFLLIRYEDMLADPVELAKHLCEFLGIERSAAEITLAVENSNRSNMQRLEQIQTKHH